MKAKDNWPGARISAGLSIEPHAERGDFWTLRGHGGEPAISASSRDLLDLARLIEDNLHEGTVQNKVNWLREYRRTTNATLQEAMTAWEKRRNAGDQGRSGTETDRE